MQEIKDYITDYYETLDFENLKRQIRDRKVYIWGAVTHSVFIKKIFLAKGIDIAGYIDSFYDGSKYDELSLFRPDEIGNASQAYLIIPLLEKEEISAWLKEHGFSRQDCSYPAKERPVVRICELNCNYTDSNGNCIEIEDDTVKINIKLVGRNNYLKLGKDLSTQPNNLICLEDESSLLLGNNASLGGDTLIWVRDHATIQIGDRLLLHQKNRIMTRRAKTIIGNHMTPADDFRLSAELHDVQIGDDFMSSHRTTILGTSSHCILNLSSSTNELLERERGLRVGNHVWLGANTTLLPNTEIGDGCVVGAGSVVKNKFDKNVIIAGNPARIIKTDYSWERQFDHLPKYDTMETILSGNELPSPEPVI